MLGKFANSVRSSGPQAPVWSEPDRIHSKRQAQRFAPGTRTTRPHPSNVGWTADKAGARRCHPRDPGVQQRVQG
jgi:hypothetical protein